MIDTLAMGEAVQLKAHMARLALLTERLACWLTVLHISASIACGQPFRGNRSISIIWLLEACLQLFLARTLPKRYMKHHIPVLVSIRVATLTAAWRVQHGVAQLATSTRSNDQSYPLTNPQHILQLVQLSGLVHMLCCHGMTVLPFWYSAALQTTYLGVLVKHSPAVAQTIMSSPSGITWLRSAHRYIQHLVSTAELSTFPFSSMIRPVDQMDDATVALIIVIFTQAFVGLVLPLYMHFCWECRLKLLLRWQAHHLPDPALRLSHYQQHQQRYQRRHILTATLLGLNGDASYHATLLCHAVIIACCCSGIWAAAHVAAPLMSP